MNDPTGRPSPAAVKALLRLSWRRFGHTMGRMPKVLPGMRQPTKGRTTTTPWLLITLGLLMLVQSFFFTRQMIGNYAGRLLDQQEDLVIVDYMTFAQLEFHDEAGDRSSEMIRSLLKSDGVLATPADPAFERFQEEGIAGFRTKRGSLSFDPKLARITPQERAPFDRMIGMVLLATLIALLFMPLALRERDLASTNHHLEWLFSLPLKGSEILLGKFTFIALVRPLLYLVLWPLLTNLLLAVGHGFAFAALLALAVGFFISVALAGIELALDTWLRARAAAGVVRNLQMVLAITGQLAFYGVLAACLASAASLPWIDWLASRVPGDLGQPLGLLMMSPPAILLGSVIVAAAGFGLGGLAISARLMRGGLLSGHGQQSRIRDIIKSDLKPRHPLRFEWLLLLRDRTLAAQVIAVPLLLVIYQLLINPRLLGNATVFGITSIAYFCGTYASLITAPQLLATEAKGAWLIYNLPIPVATYFRRREIVWRGISTGLAGLLALAMVLLSGNFAIADLWQYLAALAGVWVMGRMVSGIAMGKPELPDAVSGAKPKVSVGRTYAAMVLAGSYGALLYQGKPWPLVSALVIFWFLGAAIWQRREISFRYLMEPTEKEPPSWGVDDALWSVFVFFIVQTVAMQLLAVMDVSQSGAMLGTFLVGGSAAIAFAYWRRDSKGLPFPPLPEESDVSPIIPRRQIIRETAGACILCSIAGWLWISFLKAGYLIDPETLDLALQNMNQPMFWALAIVAAPLIEEPLFRGFVARTMTGFWSRRRTILASALLFAILHPGTSFPPVFLLGIATAMLYLRSRSLIPPIILHAIYSLVICVIAATS